jgi:hypothetical protein
MKKGAGKPTPFPSHKPVGSAVAGATGMVATGRRFVMRGAGIAAEHPALGFDGIAGADDTDAVGAGALHHFDINGHNSVLVYVIFGFKHVIHHVGEHGTDMAIGQFVEDVPALPGLLQQSPGTQQPKMLRNQALTDANLFSKLADRPLPLETRHDQP